MLPQNLAIAEGLWAATRSYFLKIQWNVTKIGSARSRLYQGIFEFSLRVRRESACISQFLKEKPQNSKKKEREKLQWKSWFFDATSYCKSEQTRLDHNSAKSARTGRRFCTSLAVASLKRIWTSLVWRNHVTKNLGWMMIGWWLFLN